MAEQSEKDGKQGEQNPDDGNPDDENSEYENFQRLLKQVLSVPKEKLDEKLAEREQEKKEGKAK